MALVSKCQGPPTQRPFLHMTFTTQILHILVTLGSWIIAIKILNSSQENLEKKAIGYISHAWTVW